ncbi:hypothetical protein MNBD_UNCLBAC01-1458 [hydrothermal vent metagenome]|uniref:Phosphatidylglycerol lysyltransferase C-terminal domain-containing protein n=1 Tax=hydrothermal vent metagenome TaxID=652676 RepID=A0A3B1D072_9ZZZZ
MNQKLLRKKFLVDEYLAEGNYCLSAFSFVNIFAWQDFFTFDFKIIQGHLCVFAENAMGRFLYLPPLGLKLFSEIIKECFDQMQRSSVVRIENVLLSQLSNFSDKEYKKIQKSYEYCYFREDVVNLRGNKYKSKRSAYNQFVKNCNFQYVSFEIGMLKECMQLYAQWASGRRRNDQNIYDHMLEENEQVHRLVIQHYQELGLEGRVVLVDGHIKGYTFGFALNKNMFCVFLEVTDLLVKGLSTYIFRQFCQDKVWRNFTFVNVMDDCLLENMKEVKMSFRPSMLIPSYVVTKNA